ncbi:MAG: glycosyltransferase family 39 protein [Candidatus Omnitrophota bacterium]|nr:glycosyltransferase family 39 protein [Candidatus Omnitrophota bacterium]
MINKVNIYILLGAIFMAALIVRIYPVIAIPEKNNNGFGIYGDSYLYHVIAYNIYSGHGFSGSNTGKAFGSDSGGKVLKYEPAVTRGPIYPFFIASVYRFLGDTKSTVSGEIWRNNWDRVRITQCVLDSFVCLLVFFMARLIYPRSYGPALIAALVYCFNFYNIFYARALLSESISTFMLTLSILFCTLSLVRGKLYWYILSGAGLGLTALTRMEYIFFPFFFAAYIFFSNKSRLSEAVKRSAVFLTAFVMIVLPWSIRNYIVFKKPIPVAIGALGHNLFMGTIETNTNWRSWDALPDSPFVSEETRAKIASIHLPYINAALSGGMGTEHYESYFMKLAMDNIRHHPIVCIKTWIMRIPRLWYQNYIPMYGYREASGGFFIFYFVFALYAFYKGAGSERFLMGVVWILFAYVTLLFMPFHIEPRYGVSLMPVIITLAGIGCFKIFYRGECQCRKIS